MEKNDVRIAVPSIPVPGISVELIKDTPSKVDPKELQKELRDIGLTCEQTDIRVLTRTINEVVSTFHKGSIMGFGFSTFNALDPIKYQSLDTTKVAFDNIAEKLAILANWRPKDTVPYSDSLSAIVFPSHFDWLVSTGFFGGKSSNNNYTGYGTLDALKEQFSKIATNVSATLVSGIDKDLMEATFVKIIKPLADVKDYDKTDNRSILLIENYNEKTRVCDGLGILNVEYRVFIKNYKDKKGVLTHHDYNLTINVRTVLYSDTKVIEADLERVRAQFKDKMFFDNALAIPVPARIEVFKELPEANSSTFVQGIPQMQESKDYIDVIVLYTADLKLICSLDNTASDATTNYEESLTKGFTFTAGQKISISASCSISVLIVKATSTVGFEVSFSEEWNVSRTKTINVEVGGRKKAYLYQASIKSRVLRFYLSTLEYKFMPGEGLFTDEHYITRDSLIDDNEKVVASNSASSNDSGRLPLWLRMGLPE